MKRFTQYLIEVAMSASDALATLGLKSGFTPDKLKPLLESKGCEVGVLNENHINARFQMQLKI